MRALLSIIAVGLVLAACGGPEVGAAPEFELGRTVCEECGMIVSDERFASGYVDEDGDHVFDDIGDLLVHLADQDRFDDVSPWVHDYAEPQWVRAEEAHFVRSTGIRSPMEFGIAAFIDHDVAADYAAEVDGEHLHWHDLVDAAREGSIRAHDHEDQSGTEAESDMEEGDHDHDH